uniref:Uncharacterized protein n=1 Tax=Ditylenchus dipsaci TaxID=166011 RepID=A0A915CSN4_9BILA
MFEVNQTILGAVQELVLVFRPRPRLRPRPRPRLRGRVRAAPKMRYEDEDERFPTLYRVHRQFWQSDDNIPVERSSASSHCKVPVIKPVVVTSG